MTSIGLLLRVLEVPLVYKSWQSLFAKSKVSPFVARTDLTKVSRVLDLGCGPGTNFPVFSEKTYIGVDINPKYVAYAQKRFSGRFLAADATRFDLGSEVFDTIMINSLLHHLSNGDCQEVLLRAVNHLSSGGSIHIIECIKPEAYSVKKLLAYLDRGNYIRSKSDLRDLLAPLLVEELWHEFDLSLCGVGLYDMVYYRGKPRKG